MATTPCDLTGGLGDIAHKTPMSARDHFKIASITKTYVATVVLQLVGEGKLSLSDSVEQWLPASSRTASTSRFGSCSTT